MMLGIECRGTGRCTGGQRSGRGGGKAWKNAVCGLQVTCEKREGCGINAGGNSTEDARHRP